MSYNLYRAGYCNGKALRLQYLEGTLFKLGLFFGYSGIFWISLWIMLRLYQVCRDSGRKVVQAIIFFTGPPNMCGHSVWKRTAGSVAHGRLFILPAETYEMRKRHLTFFVAKAEIERRSNIENEQAVNVWKHVLP